MVKIPWTYELRGNRCDDSQEKAGEAMEVTSTDGEVETRVDSTGVKYENLVVKKIVPNPAKKKKNKKKMKNKS